QVYVCRVFPDENFKQYCVHGEWSGKTAGGAASQQRRGSATRAQQDGQAVVKDALRRSSLVDIQPDSDPFWFNNPQYRLTTEAPPSDDYNDSSSGPNDGRGGNNTSLSPQRQQRAPKPVEVYISLMQQDRRSASLHARDYHPIGFEVLRTRRSANHPRLWTRDPEAVVVASARASFAASAMGAGGLGPGAAGAAGREVTKGGLKLSPQYAYVIVPHPMEQGREGKFTLRIFSSAAIRVEPVPETTSIYLRGAWERGSDRDTAGGPLKVVVDESKGARSNPKWCQNPQYWLTLPPELSADDSVDIKIVLRRTHGDGGGGGGGTGGGGAGGGVSGDRRRRSSLTHNALLGIVVCKAQPPPPPAP
ncbi:unnamed protein product, partial [Phaeothamnion confervicola]